MRPLNLALTLTVTTLLLAPPSTGAEVYSPSVERYAQLQQEAVTAFNAGQLTQAIDKFEQALAIADANSRGPAINNLAAAFMRRANYFSKPGPTANPLKALDDYRQADFLFSLGWPADLSKTDVQRGNTQIARDNLNNAYRQAKISLTDASDHVQLGQQLRQQSQFRGALVEFSWATAQDPKRSEAWLAQGDLFNVLNQPSRAAAAYKQAVTLAGDQVSDDWLVRLANMQNKSGDVNAAITTLNAATAKNPGNVAALSLLEHLWRDEFNRNPRSAVAHANLASVFQKQKRFDAAALAYKNAEALAAQDPSLSRAVRREIHLNYGTLFQQTGQAAQAQRIYEEVLRDEPGNVDAATRLAGLFAAMKQPQRAVKMYSDLLGQFPDRESLVDGLLEALDQLPEGEQANARGIMAQRFARNEAFSERLGERWHGAGKLPEAIAAYKQALAVNPNNVTALTNLGNAQLTLAATDPSQQAEALASLERARQLDPNNATIASLLTKARQGDSQQRLSQLLTQAGTAYESENYSQVLALGKQAAAISANNESAWLYQGLALNGLKRYKEAIAPLQKATGINASLAEGFYALGVAYDGVSQKAAAQAAYQRYVVLGEAKPEVADAASLEYARQRVAALK